MLKERFLIRIKKILSYCIIYCGVLLCFHKVSAQSQISGIQNQAISVLKAQILKTASWAMKQDPVTVTAAHSPRSAGGLHDFFSEGDYWWPNPKSADSPYIQKDGLSNPDNFVAHRHAMIRFSEIVGALGAAYKITGDQKYVLKALQHVKAWFIDSNTYMHPNLLYSQAIQGRFTGRGIGVIDGIQLMEVAQGLRVMENAKSMNKAILNGAKTWFRAYLKWVTTHKYGLDEMHATNNHGTCWVMQVACFSRFVGDQKLIAFCKERFEKVLLPNQMSANGGFPRELARTKPYGYSIFNLDAMSTICQILSTSKDNLWEFKTADNRNMHLGIDFLYPYLKDKSKWPYKQDVMYWSFWPVAQPSLLFAANAFHEEKYFLTWKKLDHHPTEPEIIRNLPIRNPIIWL